ncbi:MAG: hypothetical protein NTV34_16590 [Proteobacteria bacterium]|nr:hypothetical protein [Pseudomonadota bacterium]
MKTLRIALSAMLVHCCITLSGPVLASDQDHVAHANHGFVVLGEKDPHLYHLSRFDSPHQWQGVFQVSLKDANGAALDVSQIQAQHGRTISLASSEHFDLVDWASALNPRPFKADIYKGYLRSPDKTLIARGIKVQLIRTEYFKEIKPTDRQISGTNVILSCDSVTNAFFGFHQVKGSPSFEEIVTIEALYQGSPEACCSATIRCEDSLKGAIVEIQEFSTDRPIKSEPALHGDANALSFGFYNLNTLIFDDRAIHSQ